MHLKKFVFAFIVGLILFLSWAHPANATIVAPAPARPLIVNPRITGGTLAPAPPNPLMPSALPGSAPIPYYYPVGFPVPPPPPSNPICLVDSWAIKHVDPYRRFLEKMYTGTEVIGTFVSGKVPANFSDYLYRQAYQKLPLEFRATPWGQDNILYGYQRNPGAQLNLEPMYLWRRSEGAPYWIQKVTDITFFMADQGVSFYDKFELSPIQIVPECSESEEEPEEECSTDGLLKCLFKVFSKKFPFGILNAIPDDRGLTCPTFTFFDRAFNICWLYGLIAVFKYPIILGLLVRVVLYL